MYCQGVYLRGCLPERLRYAVSELPEMLDETYERPCERLTNQTGDSFTVCYNALRELSVHPVSRNLTGGVSRIRFHCWANSEILQRLAPGRSCRCGVVPMPKFTRRCQCGRFPIMQFSHLSVKEIWTSSRLKWVTVCRRRDIFMASAHTLVARVCREFYHAWIQLSPKTTSRKVPSPDIPQNTRLTMPGSKMYYDTQMLV